MADRDQTLIDFQAITGLENLDECIAVLESNQWDLMTSIESVMGHLDSQTLPSENADRPASPPPPPYVEGRPAQAVHFQPFSLMEPEVAIGASPPVIPTVPPANAIRMINFKIEYRERNINLVVPDTQTVGDLKGLLEGEVGMPPNQQVLRGWSNRRVDDQTVLKDLNLPKDVTLFLLTPDLPVPAPAGIRPAVVLPNNGESPALVDRLSQTFTLNIRYKDTEKTFRLNFPGSKTVREVKGDIFSLIDVPVRHQQWSGWPDAAKDESMTLASCGIGYPCHNLDVCESRQGGAGPSTTRRMTADDVAMELDGSEEEFEDAQDSFPLDDDIMFGEESESRKMNPLMPDNVDDDVEALEHLSREFSERYGDCHPVFYIGSLDDAIKDSLLVKAKERKLLAVYLHHDASILVNVFCSQILCAEGIVNYLSNNFITWAWDTTCEENRKRLLNMVTTHFGSVATTTVRNFKPDQLPLLLIITRTRSTNEVLDVIQGNVTLDELMTRLIQSVENFQEQQRADIVDEEERDQRESMRAEQDRAYQESLAADRAKAEARRAEEEEKRRVEMEEEMRKQAEENQRIEEEAEKEAIRQSAEDQVPDEPAESCTEPVSVIRMRVPGGETITRRFLAQHPLQVLFNYITSRGYHVEDYKVLTTFPRRDISAMDHKKTLQDLKLYPQETIILEEKHSD